MKHWNYLKYLLKHKWFVFVAGRRIGGVSLWRLVIHDWSKFLPVEWVPYVNFFYGPKPDKSEPDDFNYWLKVAEHRALFDRAWLHHQHWNKHHWQHWFLRNDDGDQGPLRMPEKYVREMVADWFGAGRAITGKWEARKWYLKNHDKILIAQGTRARVENIFDDSASRFEVEKKKENLYT